MYIDPYLEVSASMGGRYSIDVANTKVVIGLSSNPVKSTVRKEDAVLYFDKQNNLVKLEFSSWPHTVLHNLICEGKIDAIDFELLFNFLNCNVFYTLSTTSQNSIMRH